MKNWAHLLLWKLAPATIKLFYFSFQTWSLTTQSSHCRFTSLYWRTFITQVPMPLAFITASPQPSPSLIWRERVENLPRKSSHSIFQCFLQFSSSYLKFDVTTRVSSPSTTHILKKKKKGSHQTSRAQINLKPLGVHVLVSFKNPKASLARALLTSTCLVTVTPHS